MICERVVGVPDLLAIINAWGTCPVGLMGGGEGMMESQSLMGGYPMWIDEVLEILTDPEIDEASQLELIEAVFSEFE